MRTGARTSFAGRAILALHLALLLGGCSSTHFYLGRSGLSGVVVDARSGEPVAGIEVRAETSYYAHPENVVDEVSVVTGGDGRWALDGYVDRQQAIFPQACVSYGAVTK